MWWVYCDWIISAVCAQLVQPQCSCTRTCTVPTQHMSLWFPASPRAEQASGEVRRKLGLFNFSWYISQWSWAGTGEKGRTAVFPPNSAISGERGRGCTLFSQRLGGDAGMSTRRALSQSSVSPTGCVICSKWDWHLLCSCLDQLVWSQGCAGPDSPLSCPAGRCRCGVMVFFSRQHQDVITGCLEGFLCSWMCCKGKQLQWLPEAHDIQEQGKTSSVSGQMERWGSPSIKCWLWLAVGEVKSRRQDVFISKPKHLVWVLNWTKTGCSSRQSSCFGAPWHCSLLGVCQLFCYCIGGELGMCGGGGLSQQQQLFCWPLLLPQQQEQQI